MFEKILEIIPTLIASAFGSFLTILVAWLSRKIEKSGKLSINCKFVHTKGSEHFGFEYDLINDTDKQILWIPVWVDIVNNSDVSKICRNLSVCSYKNGIEVDELTPIQSEIIAGENVYYGDNGVYSFVIPANSVRRYDLLFSAKNFDMNIDSFVMQYTTDNNRIIKYKLIDLDDDWKNQLFINHSDKWFTLNKKVK